MENLQEYVDDLRSNTDSQLNVELESLNKAIARNWSEQEEVVKSIKNLKWKISQIQELEITYSHVIKSLKYWTDNINQDIDSLAKIQKRRANYDLKKLAIIKEQKKREVYEND